ncbi:RNA polymerase sigma factor FliA [Salinisphaera sp. P385]|uniref:RNA polymerase sigma factor FliA n=1 Tax=Spectribacter acetivorans TaxID=3075603 RepID=A0ABU3B732_9GAMM|nr:RNA polymerase sigma factor FliA [Salinisphaera sp. P385]MDT0618262.1 RNA polymerase sigma factor FliA [Salinisphaera sp. P385]
MSAVGEYRACGQAEAGDLVTRHRDLVRRIALHMRARLPACVELDDLIQIGMLGLLEAARSFESGHGACFETYAGIRIRGAIVDEMRRNDWTPRRVRKSMREAARAMRQIEQREGRAARDSEVAAELGIDALEYARMTAEAASANVLTLGATDHDDGQPLEFAAEDADPLDQMADRDMREHIAQAIAALPEREQLIISLYYDEELNQTEIGEVIGVSYSRVSQLLGQALLRLRSHIAAVSEGPARRVNEVMT